MTVKILASFLESVAGSTYLQLHCLTNPCLSKIKVSHLENNKLLFMYRIIYRKK